MSPDAAIIVALEGMPGGLRLQVCQVLQGTHKMPGGVRELPRMSFVGDSFSPFCRALRQAVPCSSASVLSKGIKPRGDFRLQGIKHGLAPVLTR